jgi:uncharacterized membrane protein
VTRLYSTRPAIRLRGRKFFGLRGWAGKPAHPPLTDFPIVCYVLAGVFDVVSYVASGRIAHDFFIAGTLVIISGAIVSLATALTGFMDWWKGLPRDRSTGVIGRAQHSQVWRTANTHMTIMLTVTGIVIVDIIVRLVGSHHASSLPVVILSVLAALLVTLGAAYGGSLVFDYQFNVQSLGGSTAWDETEVDQLPGDKRPPS